jgi:NADH-quinone oxidoreductase subunit M
LPERCLLALLPQGQQRVGALAGAGVAVAGWRWRWLGLWPAWARARGDCRFALGAVDGIHYLLAADGISRVLVLLTGLAAVAGVLFSWNIELRTNEFFAFFLALIGGVYGVFLSFDLFLLFVFYEIAIVPKYFLIAIWGSTRREYAAMKLALYSFVGSAMVLIGLLAAYATSGSHSTELDCAGMRRACR